MTYMVRTAVAPPPERKLMPLSPELGQVHHLMLRHQAASYVAVPAAAVTSEPVGPRMLGL
jgi:hypothetical protein